MSVAIFDTEAEAEATQVEMLKDHLAIHNDKDYVKQTTKWDIPRQRKDGKWSVCACGYSDTSKLVCVECDRSDYTWPSEE